MAKKTVRRTSRIGNNNSASRRCVSPRACVGHDLIIELGDDDSVPIFQQDLADEHFVADLRERCESSTTPPIFVVADLLAWSDSNRWRLLSLIANLESGATIRFHNQEAEFDSVFDAVLHIVKDDSDVTRFKATLRNVVKHFVRIESVNTDYPIILDPEGQLFDGAHRVAKALANGQTTIKAVRMLEVPPPDEIVDSIS